MMDVKVKAGVELCRKCSGLRGPCFDAFSGCERTQRCACEPEEPRWKGYDYDTAIELCHCCSATTIPSGSRWSSFYCETCKELVLTYNRVTGGTAIPLGRHTVMNGISLSAEDSKSVVARAAFDAASATLFARVDRLRKWHHDRVRVIAQSIPGPEAIVPLEKYLAQVRAGRASAEVVFEALVVAVTTPSGT